MNTFIQKVVPGVAVAALLLPGVAAAAGAQDILKTVSDLLNMAVPIILTLAIIYFMWGLLQYILNSSDSTKQGAARNQMIYGIIAIAVMVSIWGLVGIIQSTLGIQGQNTYIVPETPELIRR